MNKVHRNRDLEHEYISSQLSIRELCRRHGITAHSLVTVQARKGKWQEKREAYQAKASDAYIERYATRVADRHAEIRNVAPVALGLPRGSTYRAPPRRYRDVCARDRWQYGGWSPDGSGARV